MIFALSSIMPAREVFDMSHSRFPRCKPDCPSHLPTCRFPLFAGSSSDMRFASFPIVIPALFCVLLLAGCTVWPERGAGGMAEHRPGMPLEVTTAADPAAGTDGAAVAMEPTRLACDLQRMAALAETASLRGRLGGQVMLAQTVSFRALRESEAGLAADSEHTLDALEADMARLSAELSPAYTAPAGCPA